MNVDKYSVNFGELDPHTYIHLRTACGLSTKTLEAAQIGLANSMCLVVVLDMDHNKQPVGMGRIIGDGGCHCQIVDICILPAHQKLGLGKRIMEKLKEYIDNILPSSCYISLVADGEAYKLYAQYGFEEVWPISRGMAFLKK